MLARLFRFPAPPRNRPNLVRQSAVSLLMASVHLLREYAVAERGSRSYSMNKVCLFVLACSFYFVSFAYGKSSRQPAGWDSQFKLPEAVDINPDPHVVEVNLEAAIKPVEYAPGKTVNAWT